MNGPFAQAELAAGAVLEAPSTERFAAPLENKSLH